MTLMKILSGHQEGTSNVIWNYYPNLDRLAYYSGVTCKTHSCIHIEIEKEFGPQQEEKIIGGYISRLTGYIFIHCSEDRLSKEQKKVIFRDLREFIDAEGIERKTCSVCFMYDEKPCSSLF